MHLPTQPGECPVVLEVTTDEGASSDALPVTAVVPEARSRPQSYTVQVQSASGQCTVYLHRTMHSECLKFAQHVHIVVFIKIWSMQL